MPIRYRKIAGDDLATGIQSANVTAAQFAALFGVQPKRVDRWLKDEVEIPHSVALFVGLIADPLVLEKALVITQYMVDKTPPAEAPEGRRKRQKSADGEAAPKRARAGKAERAAKGEKSAKGEKAGRAARLQGSTP